MKEKERLVTPPAGHASLSHIIVTVFQTPDGAQNMPPSHAYRSIATGVSVCAVKRVSPENTLS